MVRGIGVVAIAGRTAVTIGPRPLLARGSATEADLGTVASWKLLAEEALQLAQATSGHAALGALTAGRRYAGQRRPAIIAKVGSIGRILAARSGDAGPTARGTEPRRQLRNDGEVIARVVVEAGRDAAPGRRSAGPVARHPGRDLGQVAGGGRIARDLGDTTPRRFEHGEVAAVVGEVAQTMGVARRDIGGGGSRRQSSAASRFRCWR